jgi:DNA modification methylase
MARRWRAYDIKPVRDDIKRHDVTTGFPDECKGCDLIFLDPPYWSQKKGEYSDDGTNLANLSLGEFYDATESILIHAGDVLSENGHIAVIVGPTQEKGKIYDHARAFGTMLLGHFEFVNRIIVPYTTQQAKPYHVTDAKDGHYMLKLYRDLLIYRKVK